MCLEEMVDHVDNTVGSNVIRVVDADPVHCDALWDDAHPELEATDRLEDLVLLDTGAIHGSQNNVAEQQGFESLPVAQHVFHAYGVLEGLVTWRENRVWSDARKVLLEPCKLDGLVQFREQDGLMNDVQDASSWPVKNTVDGVEHEVALLLFRADDTAGSGHNSSIEVLVKSQQVSFIKRGVGPIVVYGDLARNDVIQDELLQKLSVSF